MFAVIYQSYLKPGHETQYREAWNTVARYFIEHRGANGSSLHRTSDGLWIAYSRWPDKETRDASWPADGASTDLPPEIHEAVLVIKNCLDPERKLPEICMEVMDDLLFGNFTFRPKRKPAFGDDRENLHLRLGIDRECQKG